MLEYDLKELCLYPDDMTIIEIEEFKTIHINND
jgi:hypothetical protein